MIKKMEISATQPNMIKVELEGNLYVEGATELRERLLQQIDKGVHTMEFDMNGLNYIDSSGLGVLIAIHKRCVQKGGALKIFGVKGNIKELFELTRLNKVFDLE
ncbi:STAS domain-containing protein [Bacillus sp. DTU_2020_1000418_1_SI_GHA_SEK_038]|uniref:STAS domain-containing protein n=1 Tax=Bacillus sp. DTU_2020_1000418_1_SI_GHA_SEK_038 TaxID=3077585 RepID=UPI0028E987E3|nr:STAS domain-containing protein [Bacillus sp. DTU_2020_1000418_1_SI_GHA_SEK_038]WNS75415.1 STAS domain-containing protein [Bacillus sp. DTU_2020_1000418_1_SI_GHA_SEK_038]